jgi:heme A synthase
MRGTGLHRFAKVVAIVTLGLVIAGAALVGQRDASLQTTLQTFHRAVASLTGVLTAILAVWLLRRDSRKGMKGLGLAALGAILLQGLLGALALQFQLPKEVQILHACLAHLFFAQTAAIALMTSPGWSEPAARVEDGGAPSLRTLAVLTPLAVATQIALGAAYRHQALGVVAHLVWAFAATLLVMIMSVFVLTQCGGVPRLKRAAQWVLGLTLLQVVLGSVAYFVRPVALAHVGLGAAVLAGNVALSLEVFRNVVTVRQGNAPRPNLASAGH